WNTIQRQRGDRGHWVDGFWLGLLWLAYAHTGDDKYQAAAQQWNERLHFLKDSVATHDLGFIFFLSHVIGGRLTGDETLYETALHAASSLIKRYNPRGEYLQAWGTPDGTRKDRGRANIDIMMNLELLYWASAYSGDAKYATIATQHARTSRLTMVRADGSAAQVADFDPDSGLFVHQETHQGFSFDSCWSRGLGWGLYGFATCYHYSGVESFLYAARMLSQYAITHAPEDFVPYWDYNSPDIPNTYRDSSAAAVIACGLLELADCETDEGLATQWRTYAEKITASLWEHYSTRGTNMPAILRKAARSVPHGYMDTALIYGDYYFFEALHRLAYPEISRRIFQKSKVSVL
ncbi:MAG: glucuronyl hydrolase, partial [Chloroflexi bacterium]